METHQNGLGDGIAPARDAVPAVPNLGLPTPAEDDDPAITDMDHAKQLLRDLRKQNRVYERTIFRFRMPRHLQLRIRRSRT